MTVKTMLFLALIAFILYYVINWVRLARRAGVTTPPKPAAANVGIGFVANFLDTLGIGSFATTTSLWKFFKLIDDRVIPGTLNVGNTLPTVAQAFIYIAIIQVDMRTLIGLIAAAVLGSWLGAGVAVCALHDHGQSARHVAGIGLPDHDGLVCVSYACRQRQVHS